jgi:hypothetical protein
MTDRGELNGPKPLRVKWPDWLRFKLRTLFVVIIALAVCLTLWINFYQRNAAIQRALLESLEPPPWWPVGWKQELKTSFTIEGDIKVAGKPVGAGTVSWILVPQNRVFQAPITKGRYSLKHRRMPTGRYRVEVRTDDGPEPRTLKSDWEMPMDPGFHRINLGF